MGEPTLPDGFDYIALGELLDALDSLLAFTRSGTFDEQNGEREAADRARRLLVRYRRAE